MAAHDSAGKIDKTAFTAALAVLFALAVVLTIVRFVIRLGVQKQFLIDDFFLLFGCVCAVVATGVLYSSLDWMYTIEGVLTGSAILLPVASFLELSSRFHKRNTATLALTWTSIFSVKFSFLFFFRLLVQRVRIMVMFWWVATIATLVAWVFNIIAIFLPCLHFDVSIVNCSSVSAQKRGIRYGSAMASLDIITDILIVVITVCLLRRVQIKSRQKVALASSLCLSIVMIAIAVTRVAGMRTSIGTVDTVWVVFWHFTEAYVAIIMVALVAFRSLFIAHVAGDKHSPKKPSYTSRQKQRLQAVLNGKAGRNASGDAADELPTIPRATMTGIRTFIRGGRSPTQTGVLTLVGDSVLDDYDEPRSHSDRSSSRGIRVERNIYSEVEARLTRSPNLTHHQTVCNISAA